MKDIYKRTHGKYTYVYSEGVFKVFTDLTPELPILQIETDKIKSEKDFEKEIMWQEISLTDIQSSDFY